MNRLPLILACLLAACESRPKNDSSPKPAVTPASIATKYRGSAATARGMHADVSISADGGYTVFFMDAAGEDLPAAQASGVSIEVDGKAIPLEINDTGESWTGKGALPAKLTSRIVFSISGKTGSATVPLTAVDMPLDYVCPMDPDVRSAAPGVCPRCGMKLTMGIADPVEFPLRLRITPPVFRAQQRVDLAFSIERPGAEEPVTHFETVHEKLFHLFIVSNDLQFFVHDHPRYNGVGEFHYAAVFPKPGMYRVLGDYYPSGATPQLGPQTIFVPGAPGSLAEAKLTPDLGAQKGKNLEVSLTLDPPHPAAGELVRLYCHLDPADGLEKYLGAWAHMLAASDDLIDLLHEHPFNATGGQVEFDMTFPRTRTYRVWIQFQRKGVVNTVAFNVPVAAAQP